MCANEKVLILIKVQGIVRRYNARVYANRIETMEKRIIDNQYSSSLEDEDLFF